MPKSLFFSKYVPTLDLVPKWNFKVNFSPILQQINNYIIEDLPKILTSLKSPANILQSKYQIDEYVKIMNLLFSYGKLTVSVKNVELPELKIDSEDIVIGSSSVNIIKAAKVDGELSISFLAESLGFAKTFYYAWLKLMVDTRTGARQPRNKFESYIPISIYDRGNNLIEHRIYYGCSPRTMSTTKLDSSATDYQEEITLTFAVNGGFEFINGAELNYPGKHTEQIKSNPLEEIAVDFLNGHFST